MIITSEFFSFNVWEWFLHSLVLERTESDLSKINWLRGVILLNPIVLVPWGKFPLCHTPIRPILASRDQILILIVGCVTTWSRGSHQIVASTNQRVWLCHAHNEPCYYMCNPVIKQWLKILNPKTIWYCRISSLAFTLQDPKFRSHDKDIYICHCIRV
jgi:hypothetical protein